jgi:hypothetical protein
MPIGTRKKVAATHHLFATKPKPIKIIIMKTQINGLLGAVLALLVLSFTANAASQVYDLKTDWSDTQNPNGTWSYHDSVGALLSDDPFPWTYSCNGDVLAIARTSQSLVVPGTLEHGDIFMLLSDCGVTLRWTAPANGTVTVSGTLWGCRTTEWTLTHDESALSGGSGSGLRSAPYDFSSGSGGTGALQNIPVQAGDNVEIVFWSFERCGGDEVGLNLTITLTLDSLDPVDAIENLAIAVFAMNLQNGIENSLDSKLDAAINALIDANVNNDGAACNSLAAFINAVEAQRDNKITSAQADQLIASAQQIQALLSAGN